MSILNRQKRGTSRLGGSAHVTKVNAINFDSVFEPVLSGNHSKQRDANKNREDVELQNMCINRIPNFKMEFKFHLLFSALRFVMHRRLLLPKTDCINSSANCSILRQMRERVLQRSTPCFAHIPVTTILFQLYRAIAGFAFLFIFFAHCK